MAEKPATSTESTGRDGSTAAQTEELNSHTAGGDSPTRRRMVKVLIFAGGAVAGFTGKTVQEFLTPQDAADRLRTAVGSSNPLSVAAIPEHYAETQGLTWVLPNALPAAVGTIPKFDDASFEGWVAQHGGIDLWFTYVKLIVENRWSNPVSITDIRAVIKRRPPLHGTLLWAPPQGAGVLTRFGFDLDAAQPVARTAVDNMEEIMQSGDLGMNSLLSRSPYLSGNKVDLAHRERETFEVIAGTTQSYCEFTIRVTGLIGRRTFSQVISNLGEPFKVTAPALPTANLNKLDKSAYDVVYENDFQSWRRRKG